MPHEKRVPYIKPQPEYCTGCRLCELICSFYHENVINPKKSRIRIDSYTPEVCLQNCVSCCFDICENNAFYFDKIWLIDPSKCDGCGRCVDECSHIKMVNSKAVKCDLCGGDPQCVKYCSQKGIRFVKTL